MTSVYESVKALLQNSIRYERRDDQVSCRFNYVALRRECLEHRGVFELIDSIAEGAGVLHPRLSEYVVGDFCSEHVDTIPDVVKSVSVRFDDGLNRLLVDGVLVDEGCGKIVMFDPKTKHSVLPIESGSRVVLIFWLLGRT